MSHGKAHGFLVHSEEPFNGEPALGSLAASFITPTENFYVRNHGAVPRIDAANFTLAIDDARGQTTQWSLNDLQRRFPCVRQTTTLQCAGNRREELTHIREIPGETPWRAAAIGNADFEGAPLRDVLADAGIDASNARHIEFTGLDPCERHGKTFAFGGSIPIERAMQSDVLLAWRMNGAPLAPIHGLPLRAVVPGYLGARSVKWLQRITARQAPSENYFQAHAYKLFPPTVDQNNVDWKTGVMLGEMSLTSVITFPEHGAQVQAGEIELRGYAVAGGARTIERVDVSIDGGKNWAKANLPDAPGGAWRLWNASIKLSPGTHDVTVRAIDSAGNRQPESANAIWNFKGYMNNAWHRIAVVALPANK